MSLQNDPDKSSWLDTETKALLQPTPPEKSTSIGVSGFTLVLLKKGLEPDRIARALQRIWRDPRRSAASVLLGSCPVVVRSGLVVEEALAGQFELICCDCISVFVRDEIAAEGASEYLRQLYSQLRLSPEFEPVFLAIQFVPDSDLGRRFCDQFLSTAAGKSVRFGCDFLMRDRVFRKKARMMAHWATEIGVRLAIEE